MGEEVVRAAAKQTIGSLRYACFQDHDFARDIVKSYPSALEFVDVSIRCDAEVVLAAIMQDSSSAKFASAELLSDKVFMLAACKRCPMCFLYASEELKSDSDMTSAMAEGGDKLIAEGKGKLVKRLMGIGKATGKGRGRTKGKGRASGAPT